MIRPAVFAAACLTASSASAEALRILNWDEYIDPAVLDEFTAETGIEVVYHEYDDAEVAEASIASQDVGYDLAVVSSEYFGRLNAMQVIQPMQRERLSNLSNLDAEIMAQYNMMDGAGSATVPYLWGTTGIGYDAAAVAERMPDAPVDSWAMIFDPAIVSRFADCGVSLLDVPEEMFAIALNYLGHDPATSDAAALAEARDLLASIAPFVRTFDNDHSWRLSGGESCLAVGWSGDVLLAIEDQGEGQEIVYSVPKEGAPIWFDVFVIPSSARNVDAAHRFIDFVLRPEIIARITNEVWYPNPNSASFPAINAEVLENPAVYPGPEQMTRLFPLESRSAGEKREIARMWRRLKLGV